MPRDCISQTPRNPNQEQGSLPRAMNASPRPASTRNSLNMQGMGKQVPYIFAGSAATDTPSIGTYCYAESSAYPYDTRWYNLAYEYGSKGTMALGLFLDGSVRMIDRTNGVQMNDLFSQQTNLP